VLRARRRAELEHVAEHEHAPRVAVHPREDAHARARRLGVGVVRVVEDRDPPGLDALEAAAAGLQARDGRQDLLELEPEAPAGRQRREQVLDVVQAEERRGDLAALEAEGRPAGVRPHVGRVQAALALDAEGDAPRRA
jgi:hypothetical protein